MPRSGPMYSTPASSRRLRAAANSSVDVDSARCCTPPIVSEKSGWSWPGKSKNPSRFRLPMSKKKWLEPGVVPVLHELDQREAEHLLVELDRLLDVAADQREVVHPPHRGGRALAGRAQVLLLEGGTPGPDGLELIPCWLWHPASSRADRRRSIAGLLPHGGDPRRGGPRPRKPGRDRALPADLQPRRRDRNRPGRLEPLGAGPPDQPAQQVGGLAAQLDGCRRRAQRPACAPGRSAPAAPPGSRPSRTASPVTSSSSDVHDVRRQVGHVRRPRPGPRRAATPREPASRAPRRPGSAGPPRCAPAPARSCSSSAASAASRSRRY